MIVLWILLATVILGRIFEPEVQVGGSKSWIFDSIPRADERVELIVVLKRSAKAMKKLEKIFWEVSDPKHQNYGNYLSQDEVTKVIAISEDHLNAVIGWLSVPSAEIDIGVHRDLIKVNLYVSDVENLFKTKLHRFASKANTSLKIIRAAERYSLPANIQDRVEIVENLLRFPQPRKRVIPARNKTGDASFPKGYDCGGSCRDDFVTPAVLKDRYKLGEPLKSGMGSMAVAEFQGIYWSSTNLDIFNKACGVNASVDTQDGRNEPRICDSRTQGELCTEALLDIEYIRAVTGSIPLTDVFSVTYSLLSWAKTLEDMKDGVIPLVNSVSYGNDEVQQTSTQYMYSCNTEFQKLAVRGISILFASGDQGVWGRTGPISTRYHPDFPASSPYITAVGGTDFKVLSTIGEETTWKDSGGGFSNTFPIPSYQVDAVAAYKNSTNLPEQRFWNNTGRGYPDISALAGVENAYCIVTMKEFGGVGGTSASCPVCAGIVAKLNEIRLKRGDPALGFLNPFLYQNADAFNDVTTGRNSGTGRRTSGFPAAVGWDAATGLGTPDFEKLSALV
jgi:tripeptidyl-peptidase-1